MRLERSAHILCAAQSTRILLRDTCGVHAQDQGEVGTIREMHAPNARENKVGPRQTSYKLASTCMTVGADRLNCSRRTPARKVRRFCCQNFRSLQVR